MIAFRYERGVHLPGLDLWLDPWDEQRTAFVSHAHSDHIGNHREVILSTITAKLMTARLRETASNITWNFGFHSLFAMRSSRCTQPVIFTAQLRHTFYSKIRVYYTRVILSCAKGKSAEPIEWCKSDTLIMETTYGLPRYVFPPTDQVVTQLVKFCAEAIEDDATPILFWLLARQGTGDTGRAVWIGVPRLASSDCFSDDEIV